MLHCHQEFVRPCPSCLSLRSAAATSQVPFCFGTPCRFLFSIQASPWECSLFHFELRHLPAQLRTLEPFILRVFPFSCIDTIVSLAPVSLLRHLLQHLQQTSRLVRYPDCGLSSGCRSFFCSSASMLPSQKIHLQNEVTVRWDMSEWNTALWHLQKTLTHRPPHSRVFGAESGMLLPLNPTQHLFNALLDPDVPRVCHSTTVQSQYRNE